ncbi:hypothetical protein LguiA_002532 [Lonicera macranthoides]
MLKAGVVMPMPDIHDKMPKRKFLPRVISSIFSFSTSRISEMKKIFLAGDNSTIAGMLTETLTERERAPTRDKTKRVERPNYCETRVEFMCMNTEVRVKKNSRERKRRVVRSSDERSSFLDSSRKMTYKEMVSKLPSLSVKEKKELNS